MKKLVLSKNIRTRVLILTILLAAGLAFFGYRYHASNKYNDAEFKAYKKERLYCDQFYGGTHENDEQLYRNMQQSGGGVGC